MVNPPIATVVAATSATPEVGRILRTTSRRLLAFVACSSSRASLPLCLLCLLNASFPSRVTSAALVVVIPPRGERVVRRREDFKEEEETDDKTFDDESGNENIMLVSLLESLVFLRIKEQKRETKRAFE